VVDIGGGSTEFIIGTGLKPQKSRWKALQGCVSYSQRYFPDGKISKGALRQAELGRPRRVQAIAGEFSADPGSRPRGSSGTAKALAEILQMNGLHDNGSPRMDWPDYATPCSKSGELQQAATGRLRRTGARFGRRFSPSCGDFCPNWNIARRARLTVHCGKAVYDLWAASPPRHAAKHGAAISCGPASRRTRCRPDTSNSSASTCCASLGGTAIDLDAAPPIVCPAAAHLHEIGLSIAHGGFHKHSAYIIEHADMPGFSKKEQTQLARLVLAQRGLSLNKAAQLLPDNEAWAQILACASQCCSTAAAWISSCRKIRLGWHGASFELTMSKDWLTAIPSPKPPWKMKPRNGKVRGETGNIKLAALDDIQRILWPLACTHKTHPHFRFAM